MSLQSVERIGGLSSVQYGHEDKAVLFLYPPGEERKGCVRLLHQVSCLLAQGGWSSVCFDYRGDGDSPGDFSEIGLDSLSEDISLACKWMSMRYRHSIVCGVRLGARLGLEFVPCGTKMVLVAPVFDASGWLRETRRRSRFREGDVPVIPGDIDGYVYSDKFLYELTNLPVFPAAISEGAVPEGASHVKVLSYGAGSSSDKQLKEFCDFGGITPEHMRGLPFWLQGESGEYGELPGVIARLCMED